MDESRPDPDELLAQVRAEEARARRGRLRIFFGASAGVGKTYAMLEAARSREGRRHRRRHRLHRAARPGRDRAPDGRARAAADAAGALPRHHPPGIRPRRGARAAARDPPGRRARAFQPVRRRAARRAIPSAGRTSRSCWTPASTSGPRSTSSTSRASTTWSPRSRACASARRCRTASSSRPTRSSSSTCRRTTCWRG